MHIIDLFEASLHSNHLNNYSTIKLEFDLRIFENTVEFINISLTDQSHRVQNVFDIQVSAKSNFISIKKTVGEIQPSLWAFNNNSGQNKWNWIFDSNDISAIEGIRSGDVVFDMVSAPDYN